MTVDFFTVVADLDHRSAHYSYVSRCWANRPIEHGVLGPKCNNEVPTSPDHIGLCDECKERLIEEGSQFE